MRVLRVLGKIVLALVVLLLVVAGGGVLWLRGALPQTAGAITVNGISGPVEVLRDQDAVPHIRAATETDALFGLGYVHAQDRLWQMEWQRRIGNGRLSEILGPATLGEDKFLRTLGVAQAAQSAWASTDADTRRMVEAYVAGINAFISAHHGRALPVEFTILGFEPEPWQPADVLVWAKMMAWDLGGMGTNELLRQTLLAKVGAQRTADLLPAYPADGPIILPASASTAKGGEQGSKTAASVQPVPTSAADAAALLALDRSIQRDLGVGGTAIGSNAWVLGGAHTATGKPILANDPHLSAQIPSIWYLAHITGGKLDVIGATIPGLPGVLSGHNRRIAWGITNTAPDVQDWYIEHVNRQNQAEFRGAWEPMQIERTIIKVKGQPDVALEVRRTRHGPLLSDALPNATQPLAFRWTALDPQDNTIEAFIKLNMANEWFEFVNALKLYHAPMQNFVFADIKDRIGYYAPGALPIRAHGDGTLPVPGWTGDYEWTGYVPFDQLPHSFNPPEGFIVSANNKAVPDNFPYHVADSWAAPYRAARIVELIGSKPQLSVDDVAAMQADVVSMEARALLPVLLKAHVANEQARAAIGLLRGWDGSMRGDSPAAAVFQAWYQQLGQQLFADELGADAWNEYRAHQDELALAMGNVLRANSAWCDDVRTPAVEDCAATTGAALATGLAHMAALQGTGDIYAWRWDRVHRAVFPHQPFGQDTTLTRIFSRSVANGGDGFTIDGAPVADDGLYTQRHVSSYREIIDLNEQANSRFMHAVGQSGQLLSGDYSNLLGRWQRVEYMPMRFDQEAINAAARNRLVLKPAP